MLMRVADMKSGADVSIEASASVAAAAWRMRDHGLDRLVVVEDGRIVGSLGDREIIVGCIAKRRLPSSVRVGDIMAAAGEAEAAVAAAPLHALGLQAG